MGHTSKFRLLNPHQVMETITGKFHQNPLKNVGGVGGKELLLLRWLELIKGHDSGKKQSSVTSV